MILIGGSKFPSNWIWRRWTPLGWNNHLFQAARIYSCHLCDSLLSSLPTRGTIFAQAFAFWKFYPRSLLCFNIYLTIIPRTRMGYESIAHEAEGRMGYWPRGYEGERSNCFSKIQLLAQKTIETKHLSQVRARHQSFLKPKHYKYGGRFSLLVGYNI